MDKFFYAYEYEYTNYVKLDFIVTCSISVSIFFFSLLLFIPSVFKINRNEKKETIQLCQSTHYLIFQVVRLPMKCMPFSFSPEIYKVCRVWSLISLQMGVFI